MSGSSLAAVGWCIKGGRRAVLPATLEGMEGGGDEAPWGGGE